MESAADPPSPPTSKISWLHVSDLHLRVATGWAQDVVLATMLDDVRARYGGSNGPDVIFVTGDIAFSGKPEEYELAEEFLRRLCGAAGLGTERIFLVPGNHDIDLTIEEDAVHGARQRLVSGVETDRFFGSEARRRTLFSRQSAYRALANRLYGGELSTYTPSSYVHTRTVRVGAIRVRALLLDSSWLAGGGPSDAGNLIVGERQVLDCAAPASDCLTFALMHHPFSWLREFEQVAVENLVARAAQVCLRGHVHSVDLRTVEGPNGRLTTFTAGAGFQNRTADNTYLRCTLDLMTGRGDQVVHRYRHAEHRWEASASEEWKLISSPSTPPNLRQTLDDISAAGFRYVSLVTCLIAGTQTEVPLFLPAGQIAFVSCDASIPGASNAFGEIIIRLRHHFHWRNVWEPAAWVAALQALAAELNQLASRVDDLDSALLSSRDYASSLLLSAVDPSTPATSAACSEIQHLLQIGDIARARAVMDRWQSQGVARPDESAELRRLNVFLLLAEQDPLTAYERALELVKSPHPAARDLALAARCAHDTQDFARAADLMHMAIDSGIGVQSVRSIARSIAGKAGDSRLAKRVL